MGEPQAVQVLVGRDHFAGDPGPLRPVPAGPDDLAECPIESDRELAGSDRPAEPARDVQPAADVEYSPRVGGPPEDRVAVAEPGEHPLGVGPEEAGRVEGPADPDQPVLVGERRGDPRHVRVAVPVVLHFPIFSRSFFASAACLESGYLLMISSSVALALSVCFKLICTLALESRSAASLSSEPPLGSSFLAVSLPLSLGSSFLAVSLPPVPSLYPCSLGFVVRKIAPSF